MRPRAAITCKLYIGAGSTSTWFLYVFTVLRSAAGSEGDVMECAELTEQ
jgi:hypothetical protein